MTPAGSFAAAFLAPVRPLPAAAAAFAPSLADRVFAGGLAATALLDFRAWPVRRETAYRTAVRSSS